MLAFLGFLIVIGGIIGVIVSLPDVIAGMIDELKDQFGR